MGTRHKEESVRAQLSSAAAKESRQVHSSIPQQVIFWSFATPELFVWRFVIQAIEFFFLRHFVNPLHTSATYEVSRSIDDASIEGFLPSWIVVLSVPEESWRATTGDRPPAPPARGDDLGEYCSTFRNGSEAIVLP
uniref:Uncharacterized protein n=1 Tax=Anopheles merus TaxID=30066 RepID=A0A182V276_ANOME